MFQNVHMTWKQCYSTKDVDSKDPVREDTILQMKAISDHGLALWNTVIRIFFHVIVLEWNSCISFTHWHVPPLIMCECLAWSNKCKHFFIQGIPFFLPFTAWFQKHGIGVWTFPLLIPAHVVELRSHTVNPLLLSNERKIILQQLFSKQSIILKSALLLLTRQCYLRHVLWRFCERNMGEFSPCHRGNSKSYLL